MAALNVNAWIPEDPTSTVIQKVNYLSAAETFFTPKPMSTLTKSFPRSSGADVSEVAKSGAYPEDNSTADEIVMTAKKFGRVFRIAEEDIDDNLVNVLETKKLDYATAYAKFIDNATIATTAAVGAGVPFTSIYRAVTTVDAATGYAANAHYLSITGTGAGVAAVVDYDTLSDLFGLLEVSDYFDESAIVAIAHPSIKNQLRKIKDTADLPVFVDAVGDAQPATLWGYPLKWSHGARTSATATSAPTGNPLVVALNKDFAYLGTRSGPESVVIDGKDGTAALTDETILKCRTRRGFLVAMPHAMAVLELKPGA